MEFNIDPKRLALQDAAGMQIVQIIRELVAEINNSAVVDPYDSLPSDLGTASAGSSNKYARGDHVHPKPSAADIGACPTVQKGSIPLSATWSGNGPYTQPVTVTGATVTANSEVDLQPDATALAQLISDGVIALFITNNNGTLTATAIGAETTAALTIQCTVTEVTV